MENDDQYLNEKLRLLLQRERELFELRLKHEQMALWLNIGQALPELFLDRNASPRELWDRVRKIFARKLRLQRVLVLEVHADSLRGLAPVEAERPLPEAVRALLEVRPSGWCNDAQTEPDPGAAGLGELLNLQLFMWSCITGAGGAAVLIAVGFDRTKAAFQQPFTESDAAHLRNAAQHVQSLLGNALLIAELEREKAQLEQANLTLERRDGELKTAAAQLRAANETLEQRVLERTHELAGKNRELRLVLDNVDQALLTVDLEGRLAPGRSRVFEQWFGPCQGTPLLVQHVACDDSFEQSFKLGLEALTDDFLPREVCVSQMPHRLTVGERHFECRFLPIEEGEQLVALLLVMDDVTEQLVRAREDAEQRELLAAFMALMRDRNGFLTFFNDSQQIFRRLAEPSIDETSQKQLLHTLKGNASTFGLLAIAGLCHAAESELASGGSVLRETSEQLQARWSAVVQTLRAVMPGQLERTVEISERELRSLIDSAQAGSSARAIVEQLQRLRREPIARPLGRLAEHARALATRLERGSLQVEVVADDLRLDPEHWTPLWAALIHVVRNAVDHGIEPPDERRATGKSPDGRLRLSARRADEGFCLEIEDDGRGIDWETVRRACEEQKRPAESRSELFAALLSPGFSTRKDVTETSGRGIGLSALASVVQAFAGTLSADSESGRGTRWALKFPTL